MPWRIACSLWLVQPQLLFRTPYQGVWKAGAGDQAVEIVLDEDGAGTMMLGAQRELPPFNAVSETYLLDVAERDADGVAPPPLFQRGFRYRIVAQAYPSESVRFSVQVTEPWTSWCRAQAPVRGYDCFRCVPASDAMVLGSAECPEEYRGCFMTRSTDPSRIAPVHCGRLALCGAPGSSACSCNADGCYASSILDEFTTLELVPDDPNAVTWTRGAETKVLWRER